MQTSLTVFSSTIKLKVDAPAVLRRGIMVPTMDDPGSKCPHVQSTNQCTVKTIRQRPENVRARAQVFNYDATQRLGR